jgi:uncharacterized protein YdhG (YjbR/CyaY superfamily)
MPTKQATKSRKQGRKSENLWTDEERAAAQAAVQERQAASRRSSGDERADGLQQLRDSIGKMPADDRAMAERIHEIVSGAVPALVAKTYYGMPAYATEGKNGKVICFFKPKSKFKVRYSTFGFQPDARLDDGDMWPTEFAVIALTSAVEKRIADLARKGAG